VDEIDLWFLSSRLGVEEVSHSHAREMRHVELGGVIVDLRVDVIGHRGQRRGVHDGRHEVSRNEFAGDILAAVAVRRVW
jgi:hypothetical protein